MKGVIPLGKRTILKQTNIPSQKVVRPFDIGDDFHKLAVLPELTTRYPLTVSETASDKFVKKVHVNKQ